MIKIVTAMEARRKFGEILNRVHLLGEEIIIERSGKKIAKLCPVADSRNQPKGKLDFRKAAGLGREAWNGIDAADYVKTERDSWD